MKTIRKIVTIMFCFTLTLMPVKELNATVPAGILEVIKAGVIKVIKAVDLRIQRLQNKTIWLQNAQKTIENAMAKLKLQEITDWTEKQKVLYQEYFEELHKVKTIITYYQKVRAISEKQARLLSAYQKAWNLLKNDTHFTPEELHVMSKVYGGMLKESAKNIDLLLMLVSSFQTQMSDAKRLELINQADKQIEAVFYDLVKFNRQNIRLSLMRAKEQQDIEAIKRFYELL
ncbi:conjugal transfer protein TraI [Solitalea lacus]|uniref:conjugal transfer protein TraI n=1 Tax=Solitalea lacus TaxID=2911172 RepID=UPI001EDA8D26|nr:conjugal transfer protein TraI [Solitalea lacus]UKJ09225.1 conjugal transfer protein TraI [Solitalea lacus]